MKREDRLKDLAKNSGSSRSLPLRFSTEIITPLSALALRRPDTCRRGRGTSKNRRKKERHRSKNTRKLKWYSSKNGRW